MTFIHQIKNTQASCESTLLLTAAEDAVAELMLKGVSHNALAQLDKHSEEKNVQRISELVTSSCDQVDKMVRTDVPELCLLETLVCWRPLGH